MITKALPDDDDDDISSHMCEEEMRRQQEYVRDTIKAVLQLHTLTTWLCPLHEVRGQVTALLECLVDAGIRHRIEYERGPAVVAKQRAELEKRRQKWVERLDKTFTKVVMDMLAVRRSLEHGEES